MLKDRIKSVAFEHGLSLTELEQKLGFGNGVIGKWDKHSPSLESFIKVCNCLNVSVDFLLERNGFKMSAEAYELAKAFDSADERDKELIRVMLKDYKESKKRSCV